MIDLGLWKVINRREWISHNPFCPSMYEGDSARHRIKARNPLSFPTSTSKLSSSLGYLARPKLGALKNLFAGKSSAMRPLSYYGLDKKKKSRKSNVPKMDYRKKPDYADTAYREAVSRLRILLAESYTPIKRPLRDLDSAGEETDNQSVLSGLSRASRLGHFYYHSKPFLQKKYPYFTSTVPRTTFNVATTEPEKPHSEASKWDVNNPPPELMSFIERQEDYIEQLEKESRFCREELSTLLSKVKDVISENENLHEKQKNNLIKSVFNHLETETETETEIELGKLKTRSKSPRKAPILEGPTIVFESRISELEAQLTQAKIDLKKAQDENESYRKKISDGTLSSEMGYDTFKKQLEALQRDKNILQETVNKLQNALSQLREKENDSSDKVKRSLDVAEQAQYERSAAEHEIRRLKDELERQHAKIRDTITDQSRRIAEERNAVERRYTQQIEQLTNEQAVQWEKISKLQLELDKQRREDSDLKRELAQKQAYIDELKKEMQNKIITMQSDIGVSSAEKSALEQQIASLQMNNERNERQSKQEQARLQAEMQSLRQRLDRADAELIHSRRENIRLTEQVAALEKEIKLNAAMSDERNKRSLGSDIIALPPPKEDRDKEMSSMIKDMESKHVATVAELEGMIHSQNQLMDKLSNECHALTQKLEDASARHKEEIRELQTNLDLLTSRLGQQHAKPPDIKEIRQDSRPGPTQYPSQTSEQHIKPTVAPTITKSTENASKAPTPQPNLEKIVTPSPKEEDKPIVSPRIQPNEKPELTPQTENDEEKKDTVQEKENIYPEGQYPDQQYYDQQQYDQQGYDTQQYDQYDPNLQYMGDPNQQYDPNAYAEQNYDPNNPNQPYMTQEQYDQQYGYSGDPNMQYDPNQTYEGAPYQPAPQEGYEETTVYETEQQETKITEEKVPVKSQEKVQEK